MAQNDEEHRRSLARDLHDNVLPRASRLRTQAASLQPDDLAARLDELVTSLRQTIDTERTSLMESGIVAALQDLIDDLKQPAREQHTSLRLRNLLPQKSIPLSDERNTALYRIAQEALSNVIKHAQASDAVVTLKMDADTLEIEIKDNGIGMADAQREPPGHYGLMGMRERAAMIGATLSIISAPDEGTAVRVRLKP
jgi:signal transduction histidine kinase